MRFSLPHFKIAVMLLVVEVLIAAFMKGNIIRTFGGDFLVVMLLYLLVRAFSTLSPGMAAILVLLFSWTIECLQHFKLVERLHLQGNRMAEVIIGTRFDWLDLLAYSLGVLIVHLLEKKFLRYSAAKP